uniref:Si:ch211-231f6.6 n=1 Tax=Astyanax mexicanus TaxID=7994 RepID=A0A8B9LA96_ASTMX
MTQNVIPFFLIGHAQCEHCQSLHTALQNPKDLQPIKFSTSKGSHRTWRVERSMGSTHQRPWWKVLPFSIMCVSFVLWCFLRKESDVDKALEKQLYEHLPGSRSSTKESLCWHCL